MIGCIDCTHVAIFPPPINNPNFPENIFVNRKNYRSINVQLICDVNLYIYHGLARFPGGCHYSHIWNTSNVQQILVYIYNLVAEGYFKKLNQSIKTMVGAIARITRQVKDFRRKSYGPNVWSTQKPRAILKDGEYNIIQPKFSKRYIRYIRDIFTSLVDAEWKWTIQVMLLGFTGCWLTFALLWWLIAFVHTDLHEDHMPAKQSINGWTPCVLNIYGFHSCFLYSLETQSTMGYGLRMVTEECPEAIFLLCAQCIIGTMIDSFTVGVVFAKLTRPRLTAYTIQFSKNAVVCIQDNEYCLMLRVGDLRKCKLIGVSIKAFFIENVTSKEGEKLDQYETELDIQCDEANCEPLFLWPINVVHKIKENSPFFNLSASQMLSRKFEIVIILEGTIESTGQSTNAKTSYLENEILWGQKFQNMVFYNEDLDCYEVDYKFFDKMKTVHVPICSAAEYEDLYKEGNNNGEIRKRQHTISSDFPKKKKINDHEELTKTNERNDFRSKTPPFPVWV